MEINSILRGKWSKLGFRFSEKPLKGDVDLESTLIETAQAGREDPKLISAIVTWLTEYSDLVNLSRLSRLLNSLNSAVIGAVFDTAIAHNADKRLMHIIKKCRPVKTREHFFTFMGEKKSTRDHEIDNSDKIFLKWGFYCSSVSIKTDALHSRRFVQQHNKNLAVRAVFGPNIRAEILFHLGRLSESYARHLSLQIGVSYQPVYSEIKGMLRNGMVQSKQIGKFNLISLSPRTVDFLNVLPV